jgi:hypothetical protein
MNLHCNKPAGSDNGAKSEAHKPAGPDSGARSEVSTSISTPDPKALVAYYSFGGNARDESGNDHDGVVHGATLCADESGRDKNAYAFDGDDYIVVDSPPSVTTLATFAAWIRLENHGESVGGYVLDKGRNLEHETFSLGVTESRVAWVRVHVDGSPYTLESSKPVSIGEWTHIAGVYDGGGRGLTMYVDGEFIGNQPVAGELDQNSEALYFGCDSSEQLESWEGAIDEVRIYDKALTEAEVKYLCRPPEQ